VTDASCSSRHGAFEQTSVFIIQLVIPERPYNSVFIRCWCIDSPDQPLFSNQLYNVINMLALVTTTALVLASPVTLKNPPSLLPISQHLSSQYLASAWSPDNSSLYLASPLSIDRFIISQSRLDEAIYVQSKEDGEINTMAITPSGNVVLGIGRKVIVLEYVAGSAKVLKTYETHGSTITALAVSNDSTLIASASLKGVHIHDVFVPAKLISLPLPIGAPKSASTMTFHPHVRTRLLLSLGCDILVYDVDKPSAPVKPISIGRDVVGIACSPFSKTLVAVASTGNVGLVDLDKDKRYVYKYFISLRTNSLGIGYSRRSCPRSSLPRSHFHPRAQLSTSECGMG